MAVLTSCLEERACAEKKREQMSITNSPVGKNKWLKKFQMNFEAICYAIVQTTFHFGNDNVLFSSSFDKANAF